MIVADWRHLLVGIAGFVVLAGQAAAAPGDLDPTFGVGGVVVEAQPVDSFRAQAIGLQPSGSIVVAADGRFPDYGGWDGEVSAFTCQQCSSQGQRDLSFGDGGLAVHAPILPYNCLSDLALDGSGRILLTGYVSVSTADPNWYRSVLIALQANGDLDAGFGINGVVAGPGGVGSEGRGQALLVGGNGDVLSAGVMGRVSNADFALLRQPPVGGFYSFARLDVGTTNDWAEAVAEDAAGRVLLAGYTYPAGQPEFAVMRLLQNGSIDGEFGDQGVVDPAYLGLQFPNASKALGILVQPSGRIVVAVWRGAGAGGNAFFELVGLTPDGDVDVSFGNGGVAELVAGASLTQPAAVAVDSLGNI